MGVLNDAGVLIGDSAKGAVKGGLLGLAVEGAVIAGGIALMFLGGGFALAGVLLSVGALCFTPSFVALGAGTGAVVNPAIKADERAAARMGVSVEQAQVIGKENTASLRQNLTSQAQYNDALMARKNALMARVQQNALNAPHYQSYSSMPDINPDAKDGHVERYTQQQSAAALGAGTPSVG